MKILYVTDIDLGQPDGPTAHVLGFVKACAVLGHDVALLAPPPSQPARTTTRLLVPPVPRWPKLMRPLFSLSGASFARRHLQAWRPDLVYCRISHFTHPGPAFARQEGVRLLAELNGITEIHLARAGRHALLSRLVLAHERDCLRLATRIVTVTPLIRAHALARDPSLDPARAIVAENGVDADRFQPCDRTAARAALGLPTDAPVLGYTGTLLWWQGLETLLDAFALVAAASPQARLLIAGHGEKDAALRLQAERLGIAERVLWTGAFPHDRAPALLAACDLCVVPKRPLASGYSPIKLYEYLACARPVIASDLPGFEIVREREAGLLVPPEDPAALAEAILRLAADPGTREAMGRRGRELVCERFTWRHTAEKALAGLAT